MINGIEFSEHAGPLFMLADVHQTNGSLLHCSHNKTSFHGILHSRTTIGVAILALRLPIDKSHIHT